MGVAYQIRDQEIEPAYRTGRHDGIVTPRDDYFGDLPAARQGFHPDQRYGTSYDH